MHRSFTDSTYKICETVKATIVLWVTPLAAQFQSYWFESAECSVGGSSILGLYDPSYVEQPSSLNAGALSNRLITWQVKDRLTA